MLKTKYLLSALCMLVAMTMATSAFAQGIFSVSSGVEPRAREHGFTEAVGDIALRLLTTTEVDEGVGTLSIDYGATITNPATGSDAITVTGTGCFENGLTASDPDDRNLTVAISATRSCVVGDRINVTGVLMAISGSGLTADIEATVAVSGGFQLPSGGNRVTIVNAVVDELTDAGVSNGKAGADILTLVRHKPESDAPFHLRITENTIDSFEETVLTLSFSGIPAGATINLDAWTTDADGKPNLGEPVVEADPDASPQVDYVPANRGTQIAMSPVSVTSIKSTSEIMMYFSTNMAGDINPDEVDLGDDGEVGGGDDIILATSGGMLDSTRKDTIIVRGYFTFDATKLSTPLGDLDVQVTVDVGPEGVLEPTGATDYKGVPRFSSDPSAAVTVIDTESSQTTLVLPYALSDGRFDTGIAVSNMNTGDSQAGAVMFELYMDGEKNEYQTKVGSPGRGLVNGQVEAGSTYAVLLSELLELAGLDAGSFTGGYVKVITDFTMADGVAYISDWAAFTATATLECTEGCRPAPK